MSKRILCKFFAQGACLKGDHCDFLHNNQTDPSKKICSFYQKGHCSYGSRCRFQHGQTSSGPTLSATSTPFFPPTKPADRPICSSAASGSCPNNDGQCPNIHGNKCPACGKYCLHPYKPKEAEDHIKACQKQKKHLEAIKRSREIECSVCLEKVLSKPTAAERKFGLLAECDHSFCISCIRNWRSSSPTIGMDLNSSLRACPLCRKLSYFVIPSVIWYCSKEEKQEIVANYKSKLRSIDCKHFEFGNGTCPFGTSCFYKHTVEPGSYLWNSALGLENDGQSFLDRDETETIYSADELNVGGLNVFLEHLYRPHIEDDDDDDEEEDEIVENESVDDELDEEELSLAEAMAFLLMQPGFDGCDLSSDIDDDDDDDDDI